MSPTLNSIISCTYTIIKEKKMETTRPVWYQAHVGWGIQMSIKDTKLGWCEYARIQHAWQKTQRGVGGGGVIVILTGQHSYFDSRIQSVFVGRVSTFKVLWNTASHKAFRSKVSCILSNSCFHYQGKSLWNCSPTYLRAINYGSERPKLGISSLWWTFLTFLAFCNS